MFDFLNNSVMENRTKNKKTVRRLLDKYGTLDNFMQNSTMAEDLEYKLAQGDSIVDEVERERQAMMRAMNSLPKQQGSSLDDNDMMRNANLLKPTVGTSIFDTENGKMTPLKYMLNYPNMPMPPLEYFLEQNKKYANNQLSSTQSDAVIENNGSYNSNKTILSSDEIIGNYLSNTFYTTLGYKESSNDYQKKLDDNQGVGAVGKYQFRKPAFQETGYMDKNGNFTGKDGINSVDDFANNPKVQEKAVQELLKKNYNYMIRYKVLSLVGANIAGKVANFPITVSGMLAASHKEGGPMTAKYLKSLEKNKEGMYYLPYHKYKGNTLRSFLAIETRLREFANLNSNN